MTTKFTLILVIATQCSKLYVHRQFRDLILMTLVSFTLQVCSAAMQLLIEENSKL
jgi:hypothetical protein